MAINISNVNSTSNFSFLAPWTVHKVFLTEVSHESKNDKNGNPYHALKFTFSNDTGDFSQAFFCPVGADEMKEGSKRTMSKENNYEQPSKEEQFVLQVLHVIAAAGEQTEARFRKFYGSNDPTVNLSAFDKFCAAVAKLANEAFIAPKLELQLKLNGNKEGYATIPFCVGIKKNGEPFISKPFLAPASAKPMTFTAKEMAAKAKIEAEASSSAGASRVSNDILSDDERNAVRKDLDDFDVNDI